jgi:hypothetical protein
LGVVDLLSPFLAAFRFSKQEPVLIAKESDIMSSRFLTCVLGIAVGLGGAMQAHERERIPLPSVPGNLEVTGFKPFLKGHAIGTQNYMCAPAATPSGVDWVFIGPQATLFNDNLEQIVTHFFSRNPARANAIQATWQHSRDTSAVWATRRDGSLDARYVAPGAIEWLLLDVSGDEPGPTGGDKLSSALFVQRINTRGGVAPPSTECTPATVNTRKFVPYTADYYFYK